MRRWVVALLLSTAPMTPASAAEEPVEQEHAPPGRLPAPWVPALGIGIMVVATTLLALQARGPRERVIRKDR